MKKIRVVHVAEDMNVGGMEKIIASLARAADKNIFDVSVLCLTGLGAVADALKKEGIKVELFGTKYSRSYFYCRKLADYFRLCGADAVHAHGYAASVPARIASRVAGVPAVYYHVHSSSGAHGAKQIALEKILSLFTTKIIACSNAAAAFAAASGAPRRKITVVYNGAPAHQPAKTRAQTRKEFGISDDDFVFVTAGRVEPLKGVSILLDAARIMASATSRRRPVFIVAGEGSQKEELAKRAREAGLADVFILAGFRPDIQNVLGAADAAVLPSVEREGLSLFLAEALSAGLPVVGSAVGGIPEIVSDGENGLVVPPRDSAALAAAMTRLMTDEKFSADASAASAQKYRARFSESAMVAAVGNIYKDAFLPRVLYVHDYADVVGGGQISFLGLAAHMPEGNFRFVTVVPRRGTLSEKIEALGIRCRYASLPSSAWVAAVAAPFYILKIMFFVRRLRAVLLHSDSPRIGVMCGVVSKICGIPSLFHARTADSAGSLDGMVFRLSRKIVCSSRATAGRYAAFSGHDKKIVVVHNGVDTSHFRPSENGERVRKELGIPLAAKVVCYCGQVIKMKGIGVLLDAFALVSKQAAGAFLLIVGDGADSPALEKKAADLNLSSGCVRFFGRRDDVRPFLTACDAAVFPTFFKEGFSRAVIEAMASGKPVVASALGGNIEAVTDGVTGFLVPPGDAAAVAEGVLKIFENPGLAAKMSAAARLRAEKEFSLVAHVANIGRIYAEMTGA